MDKAKFYAALKRKDSGIFSNRLAQTQVDSLEVILTEAAKRNLPLRHLAYVLATPYHEVGAALVPKAENLTYLSAARIRAVWPTRFKTIEAAKPYVRNPQALANKVYGGRLGNSAPNDGWNYRGRGYPQTTGKENYQESGELVGVDLVAAPERMLEPRIAAVTMIESMMRGLYTGKKLSDFINGAKVDYKNARAIINADVKSNGNKIAGYARGFEKALVEAGYTGAVEVINAPVPVPIPKPAPVPAPKPTSAASDDLIAKVQQLLREKGYPEVGNVDGDMGKRTRNAILAFEADNGLPLTGKVSDDLLVALLKAAPRQNSAKRENATAEDLKDAKGVKLGDWIKKIAGGLFASSFLGGLLEGSASFDDITNGVNDAREMVGAFGIMGPWLIGLAVGGVLFYFGTKIVREQVEAYREGRHV
jgi:putative chitinase